MKNTSLWLLFCGLFISLSEQTEHATITRRIERAASASPIAQAPIDASAVKATAEKEADRLRMLQEKVRAAMEMKKNKYEAQVDDNMMASQLVMNLTSLVPSDLLKKLGDALPSPAPKAKVKAAPTPAVSSEEEETIKVTKKTKKKITKKPPTPPKAQPPQFHGLLGALLG